MLKLTFPPTKLKVPAQSDKTNEGQNQNWNSALRLQSPAPHFSTPSQHLNLEFSPWNGRTVWLLLNLLPLSLRKPTEQQWESLDLSLADGSILISSRRREGGGSPHLGGAVHLLLLPEGWKHLSRDSGTEHHSYSLSLLSNTENQFT